MKLYTEEQVKIAMAYVHAYHESDTQLKDEEILKKLTPIELPSDEEIDSESPYLPKGSTIENWYYKNGFIEGMQCMRDKIQGGE